MAAWRDTAIEKSQAISDAWDVVKAYAGRAAEWVLFACMLVNIVEILPNNIIPAALANAVLALQAITLDVAGFGLQSLADHAERSGDGRAAKRARTTGYALIGIMIATLISATLPLLWPSPAIASDTQITDRVLILLRVVLTVLYGHVVHGLRQYAEARHQHALEDLQQRIQQLTTDLAQASETYEQRLTAELSRLAESFQNRLDESSAILTASFHQELTAELSQVRESLQSGEHESSAREEIRRLKAALDKQSQERMQQPAERGYSRPVLRALPAQSATGNVTRQPAPQAVQTAKFDARAFVYACLQERDDMKLSEIAARAKLAGQELSEATISRYRKSFHASRKSSGESSTVGEHESLQGLDESSGESSAMQGESLQMKVSNQ